MRSKMERIFLFGKLRASRFLFNAAITYIFFIEAIHRNKILAHNKTVIY